MDDMGKWVSSPEVVYKGISIWEMFCSTSSFSVNCVSYQKKEITWVSFFSRADVLNFQIWDMVSRTALTVADCPACSSIPGSIVWDSTCEYCSQSGTLQKV